MMGNFTGSILTGNFLYITPVSKSEFPKLANNKVLCFNVVESSAFISLTKEDEIMSLFEGEKGNCYEVKGLYVEEGLTRRLQALGLNDGTVITVLNRKKNGALIIRVRGTRLAIGKHISQGIEVEEKCNEK